MVDLVTLLQDDRRIDAILDAVHITAVRIGGRVEYGLPIQSQDDRKVMRFALREALLDHFVHSK